MAPFMPVMMFAILFGLPMDYEIFLISRIREELGDRNWWIPRWLERTLPRLDVEGRPPQRMLA